MGKSKKAGQLASFGQLGEGAQASKICSRDVSIYISLLDSRPCLRAFSTVPDRANQPHSRTSSRAILYSNILLVAGTSTTVPGSTTRTNIELETAIRRPEYGHGSPRTSSRARNACVAFKPAPKLPSLFSLSRPLLRSYFTHHLRTFRPCVQFRIDRKTFILLADLHTDSQSDRFLLSDENIESSLEVRQE